MAPNPLPEELLIEILLRLPVKSLMKFKFVSKSWQSLISSTYFAKSHLNFFTPLRHFCLVEPQHTPDFKHIYNGEGQRRVFTYNFNGEAKLIGSCNGLVCAVSDGIVKLWNPTARKFKTSRLPRRVGVAGAKYAYGFGYDAANDDYKVFALRFGNVKSTTMHVNVYSLASNAWRSIVLGGLPYGFSMYIPGMVANGVIYWVLNCRPKSAILAVNITTERFKFIGYPDTAVALKLVCASDSCLCLLALGCSNELYMLKEDGTAWTEPEAVAFRKDHPIYVVESSPEMWKFDEKFKFHEIASAADYVNYGCVLYRESLLCPDSFD